MREIADEVGATLMVDMAHFAGLVAGKVFTGDFDPVANAHIVTSTTHKSLRGPRGGIVLSNDPELTEFIDKGCPMVLGGPISHVMAAKAVAFAEARQPAFVGLRPPGRRQRRRRWPRASPSAADASSPAAPRTISCWSTSAASGSPAARPRSALEDAGVIVNRNSIPNDANGAWYTSGIRLGTPALTTLGMDTDDMDEVADIICGVLRGAEATTTAAGAPSKAKFTLADDLRDTTRARAADLLADNPLYPTLGAL